MVEAFAVFEMTCALIPAWELEDHLCDPFEQKKHCITPSGYL